MFRFVIAEISSQCLDLPINLIAIVTPQREYAGAYQCTAANPAGSISKSIDLDVHSVPVITNGNITDTYRVIKGEYKTLECDVSGNPTPDIQVCFIIELP